MSLLPPPTQRDHLIETGARMFHERGYTATGVRQIAAAANVPLGSFTNHFRSKEQFALAALEHYVARLDQVMHATLGDTSHTPADRIAGYFEAIESALGHHDWGVGCLIPDLAAEAPAYGELLRDKLAHVLERQTSSFATILRDLEVPDADDIASVLIAAWHGTLLRVKVDRSRVPIARFRRTLQHLLSAWPSPCYPLLCPNP